MLRVVIAVALAAALVAAVTPALEDARATRTERLTERELGRLERAAATLANEESPGARRTLALSFPAESPTATPLAFVSLGGLPGNESTAADTAVSDVFAFRVAGDPRRVRRAETDLRVVRDGRVTTDDRALVLGGGESYTVTLRLVRRGGRRTVIVSI
ncbi:DUF7311 family protein [Halorussus caseinilyticus]|uniref:DUF7311 family protein n=1 Tax=Halorussus caseinilyticus TaxID=3034025 RepID=UPI0023E820A1|nr:hypothetical protein [Halorussus sp. DT72]